MKSLYLSKTFLFNLITGLGLFLALPEVLAILPAGATPYILLTQAIINGVILRLVTKVPVTASPAAITSGTGTGG